MNIQTLLTNILVFLNKSVVPFLLAVATFIFIWNAVRYFILDGSNEESQTKAKSLAFWGISAFVIIVSLWGVVNLIVNGLGFGTMQPITPDYTGVAGNKRNTTSSTQNLDHYSEPKVTRTQVVQDEATTCNTDENWVLITLNAIDYGELAEMLDIQSSILIISIEESVSDKMRITFLDSETNERSTLTRINIENGVELIAEKGNACLKYTVTIDDQGSMIIYKLAVGGGQHPDPIQLSVNTLKKIADDTWVEEVLKDTIPIE